MYLSLNAKYVLNFMCSIDGEAARSLRHALLPTAVAGSIEICIAEGPPNRKIPHYSVGPGLSP